MEERRSIRVQAEGPSRAIGHPGTEETTKNAGPRGSEDLQPSRRRPHLHLYVSSEVQFETPKLFQDAFGGRRQMDLQRCNDQRGALEQLDRISGLEGMELEKGSRDGD